MEYESVDGQIARTDMHTDTHTDVVKQGQTL